MVCAYFAHRSLGAGVVALTAVGCAYGVLRANFLDMFSYFIFDCGVVGFYAALLAAPLTPGEDAAGLTVKRWLRFLIGWPVLLFFLPINHYLVQLVGLRHIIFFLPAMLYGTRLKRRDLETMALGFAVLCSLEFGVALLEYFGGIGLLFPRNAVTEIMYRSHDIRTSEGLFHRIPATFSSSHIYAANMLLTLPFLLNALTDSKHSAGRRTMMGVASVLAVLGIFIAGPRVPVVCLTAWLVLMAVMPGLKPEARWRLAGCVLVIGAVAAYYIVSDERMQRFTSLMDVEKVEQRAAGSYEYGIFESIVRFPIGVGLGGAVGSSMPYFLKDLKPDQVGAENEYIRIAVEQGIVGLLIWVAFLVSLALHRPSPVSRRWRLGIHAMHTLALVSWATAFVGTGILQGIPSAFLLVLQIGLVLRSPLEQQAHGPSFGRVPTRIPPHEAV